MMIVAAGLLVVAPVSFAAQDAGAPAHDDVLMRALVDELDRSMKDLVLEDLERPYFIQYAAQDGVSFSISAKFGGLVRSSEDHTRTMGAGVRVGSMALDNTNVGWGVQPISLPLDDDYLALRHAIWLATDLNYKYAVEILARKKAYLKEHKIEDRPDDFTPAPVVKVIEPPGRLVVDRSRWEDNVKRLSAAFKKYHEIENANVSFYAGASTEYLVNSEGTRYRHGDTGIIIRIRAETRGAEGMELSDTRTYIGEQFDQIPPMDDMLADIDTMCADLIAGAKAPMIEHYAGPVLFEPAAAAKMFESLLASELCAKPVTIGRFGGDDTMERKIGLRILPRGFQVFDDPNPKFLEETLLAGAYKYDDEAVRVGRVNLVEDGKLNTLLASRAPSRKIKQSTGHGRGPYGDASAHVGCLYFQDDDAISADELKAELIETAAGEGLEYGLRIAAMGERGYGSLGEPLYVYKVYVADGREEPVRGLKFLPVEIRSLKDIMAAGTDRVVYNSMGGVLSSFVAPAVLFEELELTKIEQQFETLPILKSPATRKEKKDDSADN